MAIKHLTEDSFDAAVATGRCVVDFWASWCGPCRMQAPILDSLDAAHGDKVSVCKVDVDAEPALASRFKVMSIPTLIYFVDGNVVGQDVGVTAQTAIERALGL